MNKQNDYIFINENKNLDRKKLQEETNKYITRKEFRENNHAAFIAAYRMNILDKLFKNHPNNGYSKKQKLSGYWTEEKLQEEVNKYETRDEFQKNNIKAYQAAQRRQILDKLFKNHSNNGYSENQKRLGYWTEKTLQEEANKYKTRDEFQKNNASAYVTARNKNILDNLFKNHSNNGYSDKQVIYGYWTEKTLQEEANKYKSRQEFRNKNNPAYSAATRKKLLDILFDNHLNKGYSDKEEWKENSYVIYIYELEEFNSAYVGLTNNMKRRDKEHLFDEKEKMSLFCRENDIPYPKYKILEENLTSKKAQELEKYWENFYKNNGWEMFNIAKTGSLGSAAIKWTKKALQEEANKYKNRREFQKNKSGAYDAAFKKNIIDEIFKNHLNSGYSKNKNGYWTEEKLQEEANKCKTREEFNTKHKAAYLAAYRMNILDKLFKNHSNKGYSDKRVIYGYWTEEKLQKEANKHMTRREFRESNHAAYMAASKMQIIDKLFKNHPNNGLKIKKI
jgi:hypothetical protein